LQAEAINTIIVCEQCAHKSLFVNFDVIVVEPGTGGKRRPGRA